MLLPLSNHYAIVAYANQLNQRQKEGLIMKLQDWFVVFVFFIIVKSILFSAEPPDEQSEIYCQMVEMFNQTGGDYGWPDYKETFDKECVA